MYYKTSYFQTKTLTQPSLNTCVLQLLVADGVGIATREFEIPP